ncbi:MAG TPA: helix-turn-helix transcriptional regulator, partial [Roseateles sp.]|nr:helix-turn-helix transcriptional regulator [Roseateles sp.]
LLRDGEAVQLAQHLMRLGQLRAVMLEGLLGLAVNGHAAESRLWFEPGLSTGVLHVSALPPDLAASTGWPAGCLLLQVQRDRPQLAQAARLEALSTRCALSTAEQHVLALLADGLSVEDSAHQLALRVSTVRSHVRRLLHKTGSPSLMQLLRWVGSGRDAPA